MYRKPEFSGLELFGKKSNIERNVEEDPNLTASKLNQDPRVLNTMDHTQDTFLKTRVMDNQSLNQFNRKIQYLSPIKNNLKTEVNHNSMVQSKHDTSSSFKNKYSVSNFLVYNFFRCSSRCYSLP